ncbi:rhodanese-related sulfurtransferase [Yoonia maricola]|uniref:Rhodanese-related sulfurtransferase n=1 Tax=Yoonia maricola TaxID=420999 RepID=A0A2M8W019_9RHOB|nr:rhodanese-like domain-containing protein [Yoonia maricola]PJI84264.1 rhodanese-related sulfurtransferase [Yoonia maricola]
MKRLSRRVVLTGLVGTTALCVTAYAIAGDSETLTPQQAFAAAGTGDILLVDIRRPDEWQSTGIAQYAVPIDMRRADFATAVLAARRSPTQPIALICARGVRSARMTARLTDAGVTPIIDIPEGMLGSFAGPGWVKRGLPVVEWDTDSQEDTT